VILAGDIGGTNARLALFAADGRTQLDSETYPSGSARSAEELICNYLARRPGPVTSACLAVAGPVRNGRTEPVNLPWAVDAGELARVLRVRSARVVNDLEANAHGITLLGPEDFAVVNVGDELAGGNRAVVSAGTGLGEAGLVRTGAGYHAVAGEGGHADFAPRSEIEIALYRFLASEYRHVSYERVCSGAGLVNIYRFFWNRERPTMHSVEELGPPPSPAEISAAAADDPAGLSGRALELFVSIYGARAANVALAFMATGGVYLGGGIAPRIAGPLMNGTFMRAFTAKGRLSGLLETIPVRVVLNDHAALLGAAHIAADGQRAAFRRAA
jgi:glucokinase